MEQIELAPGLTTSRVAWGFWRWKEWDISIAELSKLLPSVVDTGITLIDHANIYADGEGEIAFGKALEANKGLRDKLQLISKSTIVYPRGNIRVKYYDNSAKHIVEQAEQSLRNLKTDYLDLLLLHRPDPLQDPQEVAEAFSQLHAQGKVRYFGVSNYKRPNIELLQKFLDFPLVTNQIEASVLSHENFDDHTVAYMQQLGRHPIAWSPLAGGRIFTSDDPAAVRVRKVLEEITEEIGAGSIDVTALAWLYTHPAGFLTITGANDLKYIKVPSKALNFKLTKEQWFMIWTAFNGHKIP